ncbi:unnamed protein product [Zymoseptoria tritici ST99CH_1E4]|uniref:Uncharacterized protein n=1 Tax=Zymoseptoria tritici ST99CH_1E4 TaxID=1276532 RepID=A0A2H1HA67_ZYMTR|nr:unnamed protein product [Zymoseptoria tritici ST99CH_1E4]
MYDPPRIEVTASGYRRSPLLNTCKEVRADALKLFYSINSFNVQALQFDYSAMAKFANDLIAICTRSAGRHILRSSKSARRSKKGEPRGAAQGHLPSSRTHHEGITRAMRGYTGRT